MSNHLSIEVIREDLAYYDVNTIDLIQLLSVVLGKVEFALLQSLNAIGIRRLADMTVAEFIEAGKSV